MPINDDTCTTLLEAVKEVLTAHNCFMNADDIAEEINLKSLYIQKSGKKVLASQVEALPRKYRLALRRVNNTIGLI